VTSSCVNLTCSVIGAVPDLNNVKVALVPQGSAVSFDDSVVGRSGAANTGTVLLDALTYQGTVSTSNLNLKNGAMVVSGNAALGGFESAAGTTLTVNNTASTSTLSVDIASGATQTVVGVLNGSGAFSKAGAGTLVFTGGSAYTGGTTISAGTVQVGNAGTTGNLGTGTITNNATLVFKRSDNVGVADVIAGTGVLRQEGTGQLTLSATNTYTGSTTVNAGTLGLSSDSNLGTAPSSAQTDQLVVNNGAGLYFYPVFTSSLNANRGITLTGSTTFNTATGSEVTYAGIVAGTGSLTKAGAGTLILAGGNIYGTTTVSAGTLQIGNGSTTGTLGTGAVVDNAALVMNRSDSVTVTNAISGAGTLSKLGSNTLTLTGAQTYTGSTNIAAGTLVFQNDVAPTTPGFTGAGAVAIEPSSTSFTYALTSNYSYANTLTGVRLGKEGNAKTSPAHPPSTSQALWLCMVTRWPSTTMYKALLWVPRSCSRPQATSPWMPHARW